MGMAVANDGGNDAAVDAAVYARKAKGKMLGRRREVVGIVFMHVVPELHIAPAKREGLNTGALI
ncbi:hypothetical protein JCM19379_02020 [Methyloparacoccus murrellii]